MAESNKIAGFGLGPDIREKIRQMIDAEIQNAVSEVLADMGSTDTKASRPTVRTASVVEPEESMHATQTRRRRRRSNPRVAYAINGRMTDKQAENLELTETARIVFDAIRAADEPITAKVLEAETGIKQKTVESCAWWLRNHDREGNRVKPNSPKTIVVSVDNPNRR